MIYDHTPRYDAGVYTNKPDNVNDKSMALTLRLGVDWRKPLNGRADMGYRDTWEYK